MTPRDTAQTDLEPRSVPPAVAPEADPTPAGPSTGPRRPGDREARRGDRLPVPVGPPHASAAGPTPLLVLVARAAGDLSRSVGERIHRYRILAWPALVGLVVRLWVIGSAHPECTPLQQADDATTCYRLVGDALYARTQGHYLAKGHGFLNPVALAFGYERPGAYHPPLFPGLLGALDRLGLRSVAAQRVTLSVIGVVGILLIGVVAWRIAGRRYGPTTGVMAASIAAVCPLLWLNDTQAMSESIYAPLVVAVIGASYLLWRHPTVRNAVLVGLAIGLAWLTRAEAAGNYVLVLIPILWGLHHLSRVARLKLLAVAAATTLLVVAPWVVYNARRFPNPTYMTTSSGDALAYRLCDPTFEGDLIGYYSMECDPKPNLSSQDESAQDARSRDIALTYLKDHVGRVPLVVAARFGRQWELFKPVENAQLSAYLDNRGFTEAYWGLASFYLLIPGAVIGLLRLRRNRIPLSPLLGQLALVTIVAVTTSPIVRYRIAGDLALLILNAVGWAPVWADHVQPVLSRLWVRMKADVPATAVALLLLLAAPALLVLVPTRPASAQTTPDPLEVVPNLDGVRDPEGCELSDSLQKLYDAYDRHAAAAPANQLRRWASPLIRDELDTVVRSDGDLLRIPEADRIRITRDLSAFATDPCNIFGTQG